VNSGNKQTNKQTTGTTCNIPLPRKVFLALQRAKSKEQSEHTREHVYVLCSVHLLADFID
jgi:hypothetical protein